MTEAVAGIGTRVQRWNGSAWEDIAEVTSVKGPGKKRETIEVTNLRSIDGYKEFISGLRDGGNISLGMNFFRGGYDLMEEDFEDDDLKSYQIILPDPDETSFEFEGLITELPLNVTTKDQITMDVTIQVSGKIFTGDGADSDAPSW